MATTYKLNINGNFESKLKSASALSQNAHTHLNKLKGTTGKTSNKFGKFSSNLNIANNLLVRFATVAAGISLVQLGRSVIDRTAEFEGLATALDFASSSMEAGQANMNYVKATAKKLGLALMPAAEGYTKLTAAAKGTKLAQSDVRNLFQGISKAVSVLALNSEKSHGTFMAFEQIMSKGKVSAEELRRQLGDRIPGAFQIAARAMGVTTTELDKLIRSGKLMSEDFLPQMARQLNEEFTPGMERAGNTLRANMNRMNNQILLLKVNFGTMLIPEMVKAIKKFNSLDGKMQSSIMWVKRHKSTLYTLAKALAIVSGALLTYAVAMQGAALATALFALLINPLTLLLVVVGALATNYALFADKIKTATDAQLRFNAAQEGVKSAEQDVEDLKSFIQKLERGGLTKEEVEQINLVAQDKIANIQGTIAKSKKGQKMYEVLNAESMLQSEYEGFGGLGKDYYNAKMAGKPTDRYYNSAKIAAGLGVNKGVQDINRINELLALIGDGSSGVSAQVSMQQARILEIKRLVKDRTGFSIDDETNGVIGADTNPMAEVLGGGNRIININIAKQIESFINHFHGGDDDNIQALSEKIEDKVAEVLLSAVNEANQLG